jgi:endonuclease VIII
VSAAHPDRFARLAGARVVAAEPTGKHLFVRFDSGLALHTHLGMRGSWHLYRPGERWQLPERAASVVLEFPDAVAVCFRASIAELERGQESVAHLGPDVLGADFDPAVAAARARALEIPTAGEALLDQRAAAGIGNVFRCEVLWMHRVSPFRPLGEVGDQLLGELFTAAAKLVADNARLSAPRHFPHGRAAVHGRAGRPCPRCGTLVAARRLGELPRLVYWCPRCQPA